jgi:hypothetical protein
MPGLISAEWTRVHAMLALNCPIGQLKQLLSPLSLLILYPLPFLGGMQDPRTIQQMSTASLVLNDKSCHHIYHLVLLRSTYHSSHPISLAYIRRGTHCPSNV